MSKAELKEVNIVRASDGTFIVRSVDKDQQEITTAVDFTALTARLADLFTPTNVQEAPAQVQ